MVVLVTGEDDNGGDDDDDGWYRPLIRGEVACVERISLT